MRGSATYTLWLRSIKRYFRSRSRIAGSIAQPLFLFLALGFGLGSAFSSRGGFDYLSFIGPGVIAMTVLFTSVFSGIQVLWDKQFGFLKETLVAPVSRTSIMLGQTFGGATTALIQGLLMTLMIFIFVKMTFGIGILIALLFMVLIALGFTALGVAISSLMDDMQGFHLIVNFVIMPIFFLSGALFPISHLPEWLKVIVYINPLTYGVEGIRYGLAGVSAINPLISFSVLGAFSVVMILIGGYLFNKMKI